MKAYTHILLSAVCALALSSCASSAVNSAEEQAAQAPAFTGRTDVPWSIRMADSVLLNNPSSYGHRWDYVVGTVLVGLHGIYEKTSDQRYLDYIANTIRLQMPSINYGTKTLDNIKEGSSLLFLYEHIDNEILKRSYRSAADKLRALLNNGPEGISRTSEGGLWHKDPGYPWQMWGDGLYMAHPFYAQYSLLFNNAAATDFDDIALQFTLFEQKARNEETGLLFHGWSERPLDPASDCWANPATGLSSSFWGRAMGWYIMGLVDTLDYFPAEHPGYQQLVAILGRLVPAIVAFQDEESGCWYDVIDQGPRKGIVRDNYLEASCTAMFTYSILKSVRLGYIDAQWQAAGLKAYQGILDTFMQVSEVPGGEKLTMTNQCTVSGLGGRQKRDGSFEYYMSEPVSTSDFDGKPIGPFILASLEVEQL